MVLAARAPRHSDRADGGGRAPRARKPPRGAVRPARVPRVRRSTGATGAKYRVVGRPIPFAHLGAEKAEGRTLFGLPQDRPVLAVFGGLAGAQALNEFAVSHSGARARPCCTCPERATTRRCVRACRATTTCSSHRRTTSARARSGGPRDLARRRHRVGARSCGHPGDPRPVSARDGRPPGAERAALRGGRRSGRRAIRATLARVPALVEELLGDPERLAAMSEAMRGLAKPDAADVDRRRAVALARGASVSELPLAGRRFYFVGIGGAGLSAYANFARAWGAEVAGWDARDTIFLEPLSDVHVDIGGEPAPPAGFEVVVSTAHAGRIDGARAPSSWPSSSSLRRSIVVGGAHGKTTTAAMVAYALRELGHDPSWIIGGVVPQLGGNAGVGEGWLVVEGDESDRSIALLRPEIAAVTNVELDHHATYASEAELRPFFEEWLAGVPSVVRGWELEPVGFELRVPGEHNRANAATALAVLELAGADRGDAEHALAAFSGVGRRFELVGERGGVRVIDDYGHNPTEIAAALRTARATRAPHARRRVPAARVRANATAPPRARAGARRRRRSGRDRRHRRPRRAAPRSHRQARARRRSVFDAAGLGAHPRGRVCARTRLGATGRRRRDARCRRAVADRARCRRRAARG